MIKTNTAFTLIETLVAITIFLTVVSIAIFTIYSSNKTERISNERTTATYLASEGVELYRELIDGRRLKFSKGILTSGTAINLPSGMCQSGQNCVIFYDDTAGEIVYESESNYCSAVSLDDTCLISYGQDRGYYYDPSENKASPYRRNVTYEIDGSGDFAVVTSEVTWENNAVTIRNVIFNW